MSRRRLRRRREKAQRHAVPAHGADEVGLVREATQVERLAYTRQQAAKALGMSTSTFNRRVLPFIETVQMDWGTRLIPVDGLERYVGARRQSAQPQPTPPARAARQVFHPRSCRESATSTTRVRVSPRSRAGSTPTG